MLDYKPRWIACWLVAAAAPSLLTAQAVIGKQGVPEEPGYWHVGDTHIHSQHCLSTSVSFYDAFSTNELLAMMEEFGLEVGVAQFWNPTWEHVGISAFFDQYASKITGQEIVGPGGAILQYGLEVSGFRASQFGHVQVANISDGSFDPELAHPGPILDHFRQQPGALTGYAHVHWAGLFENYTSFPPFTDKIYPFMAPIDIALNRVDFIEVLGANPASWRSLYYKLLNSGLRVALSAGSDNCADVIGYGRTHAMLASEPLTFEKWTEAVKQGRTTVSFDALEDREFLRFSVEGLAPGGQINLDAPGSVALQVTLEVESSAPGDDTLEIVKDGVVVASFALTVPESGSLQWNPTVEFQRSGWLSARTKNHHTGAVFVIVDEKPIARAKDADYWVRYTERFLENLHAFDTIGAKSKVTKDIKEAGKIFRALRAYDSPLPENVLRHGTSSESPNGPIAMGVTGSFSEPSGEMPKVTVINAPSNELGVLLFGVSIWPDGIPINGLVIYLDPTATSVLVPMQSNSGGYAEFPLVPPSGLQFLLFMQSLWVKDWENTSWYASDVLAVGLE